MLRRYGDDLRLSVLCYSGFAVQYKEISSNTRYRTCFNDLNSFKLIFISFAMSKKPRASRNASLPIPNHPPQLNLNMYVLINMNMKSVDPWIITIACLFHSKLCILL
ncbi:hypothetical protein ACKWTF_006978 [Chironomus riparius]